MRNLTLALLMFLVLASGCRSSGVGGSGYTYDPATKKYETRKQGPPPELREAVVGAVKLSAAALRFANEHVGSHGSSTYRSSRDRRAVENSAKAFLIVASFGGMR